MNDDELTRIFRSLDEPAEPRAAFGDALFADLERTTSGAIVRRRTSVRWLLVAATLLLVASLGAALAVGSGLIKLPFVVDVVSPTSSPSGSAVPSRSSIPSATAPASPTSLPTASIPEPTTIGKLIATHDGFLAIGSAPTTGGGEVNVLLSAPSDASSWQPVDDPGFGRIIDAAAGTSSEIIVANASQDLSGKYIVWRSTDGQNWTPDSAWTSDANAAPVLTAGGPAGFLILGPTGSSSDVWTSSDGMTWTHGSIGPAIDGAVVVDGGFLAYSQTDRKVYASVNGAAWQAVSSPASSSGNQTISGIFSVGSTVVAVTCQPVERASCSVWTGTLQGSAGSLSLQWSAASDGQLMNGYSVSAAAGTATRGFMWGYDLTTYGRVAWSSNDGLHWSRTPLAEAALGAGMPGAFAAGTSAVVAVGWTHSSAVGVGRELWQSTDGLSWTPANAPMVPPPPQVPAGPCPAAPGTLQQLIDIGSVKAASCYGNASLTVRAYSSDCGGCGGAGFPRHSPDWIANPYAAAWYVSTTVTTPGGPGTRWGVWPLPSAHLTLPTEGTMVEITGHFNDPVSPDCRITPFQVFQELPPVSDAAAGCRQAFVVTSFTVVGG
jgi:hypothetical protein